jgi:hypothetical protein
MISAPTGRPTSRSGPTAAIRPFSTTTTPCGTSSAGKTTVPRNMMLGMEFSQGVLCSQPGPARHHGDCRLRPSARRPWRSSTVFLAPAFSIVGTMSASSVRSAQWPRERICGHTPTAAYHFPMHEHDRFKLLFGPYRTPRFNYGDVVTCEIRGDVKIVGLTAARIPWPKCRTGKRCRAIILYGALADAVRRESAQAIEYWWGVGSFTVWKWRKALGVDRLTEGTSALLSRWAPETIQSAEANRRREPTLKSSERRAKIAAARRGKPRPRHVIEALIKANRGRKLSADRRRKMSEAHKRRGT